MRVRRASAQEVRTACKMFHYAHAVPSAKYAYSVFNDDLEFCGCVIFGSGANRNIGSPYGLVQGQVLELVRVALNGKQGHGHTSQAVMMCVRKLKKDAPAARLLVSYADEDQGHIGTIYQATNWIYEGEVSKGSNGGIVVNGHVIHKRTCCARYGTANIEWLREHVDPDAHEFIPVGKLKYLYPLDKKMRKKIEGRAKTYPTH